MELHSNLSLEEEFVEAQEEFSEAEEDVVAEEEVPREEAAKQQYSGICKRCNPNEWDSCVAKDTKIEPNVEWALQEPVVIKDVEVYTPKSNLGETNTPTESPVRASGKRDVEIVRRSELGETETATEPPVRALGKKDEENVARRFLMAQRRDVKVGFNPFP